MNHLLTKSLKLLESGAVEAAREAARSETESPLSAQQAEAGNYRKGRFCWNGLTIVLENPAGSTRRDWKHEPPEWTTEMSCDYGYVLKTRSEADGDHIDVFLGPDLDSYMVFVVNQAKKDGTGFDEHKCMLGFHSEAEARKAYLDHYETGWKGLKSIVPLPVSAFKDWLFNGSTKKPLAASMLESEGDDSWHGVDFDGTLAHYDKWRGPSHVGEPIRRTVAYVKDLLRKGEKVKVFTARANGEGAEEAVAAIKDWCRKHIGKELPVTCEKDQNMVSLRDDKLDLQKVEMNTGRLIESGIIRTLYHGGSRSLNRSSLDGIKNRHGRWEHGPGLYLTNSYELARKYGTVHRITVELEPGREAGGVRLDLSDTIGLIKSYAVVAKRRGLIDDVRRAAENGRLTASLLINLAVNDEAFRGTGLDRLRDFLVSSGAYYSNSDMNSTTKRADVVVVFNPSIIKKVEKTSTVGVSDYWV